MENIHVLSADKTTYFNFRVAAFITSKNKVLLEKNQDFDYYNLVGGRVTFNEPSATALERELVEELGLKLKQKPKLFHVAENFFNWQDNKKTQEILFIYHIELDEKTAKALDGTTIFDSPQESVKWFDKQELKTLLLRPDFVRNLFDESKNTITHTCNLTQNI